LREIKVAGDAEAGMQFSGYGAVFGNVDFWGDLIVEGAFQSTIAQAKSTNQWPALLSQHGFTGEGDVPVGIWTEMREDSIGLYVEGKLADTPRGKELYGLMKMEPRPAINGLSIGYQAEEWTTRSKPEEPRRTLKKINLMEISLVTFPANPKARTTAVKSGLTIRDAENALRDAGFTRSQAKSITAEGFDGLPPWDADEADEAKTTADAVKEAIRRNLITLRL
jgi:hypothetical protein